MFRIQTILLPTDFSTAAEQALDVARSLARDHQAKVILLHVITPPPVREVVLPESDLDGLKNAAQGQLVALATRFPDVPVEPRALVGADGAAIVEVARDCHADLIVMGTHGRSGLSRLLLGSTSEYVLRHAPCPVLTIKPGAEQHLPQEPPGP